MTRFIDLDDPRDPFDDDPYVVSYDDDEDAGPRYHRVNRTPDPAPAPAPAPAEPAASSPSSGLDDDLDDHLDEYDAGDDDGRPHTAAGASVLVGAAGIVGFVAFHFLALPVFLLVMAGTGVAGLATAGAVRGRHQERQAAGTRQRIMSGGRGPRTPGGRAPRMRTPKAPKMPKAPKVGRAGGGAGRAGGARAGASRAAGRKSSIPLPKMPKGLKLAGRKATGAKAAGSKTAGTAGPKATKAAKATKGTAASRRRKLLGGAGAAGGIKLPGLPKLGGRKTAGAPTTGRKTRRGSRGSGGKGPAATGGSPATTARGLKGMIARRKARKAAKATRPTTGGPGSKTVGGPTPGSTSTRRTRRGRRGGATKPAAGPGAKATPPAPTTRAGRRQAVRQARQARRVARRQAVWDRRDARRAIRQQPRADRRQARAAARTQRVQARVDRRVDRHDRRDARRQADAAMYRRKFRRAAATAAAPFVWTGRTIGANARIGAILAGRATRRRAAAGCRTVGRYTGRRWARGRRRVKVMRRLARMRMRAAWARLAPQWWRELAAVRRNSGRRAMWGSAVLAAWAAFIQFVRTAVWAPPEPPAPRHSASSPPTPAAAPAAAVDPGDELDLDAATGPRTPRGTLPQTTKPANRPPATTTPRTQPAAAPAFAGPATKGAQQTMHPCHSQMMEASRLFVVDFRPANIPDMWRWINSTPLAMHLMGDNYRALSNHLAAQFPRASLVHGYYYTVADGYEGMVDRADILRKGYWDLHKGDLDRFGENAGVNEYLADIDPSGQSVPVLDDGTIMHENLARYLEYAKTNIAGYFPGNLGGDPVMDLLDYLREQPTVFHAASVDTRELSATLVTSYPMEIDLHEFYVNFADGYGVLGDRAASLEGHLRTVMGHDIRRREQPRAGDERWADVTNHGQRA